LGKYATILINSKFGERIVPESVEPKRELYGQQQQLVVESIRESNHREPKDYDAYNRPCDWVTITKYSIRFRGGGWFEDQVEDQNINIHRGDVFEAWIYNNRFTYLKNINTGKVHYNRPIINPEWVEYWKKKQEEEAELAKNKWNQKNIWERAIQQRYYLLIVFIIFSVISIVVKSAIPLIPVPIIYLILLSNRS